MPVHDWTRVAAGTFHDFHNRWLAHLTETLNEGLLPPDYYAQTDQWLSNFIADVLTLHRPATMGRDDPDHPAPPFNSSGGLVLAEAPPRVTRTMSSDAMRVAERRQRCIAVRHVSRHEVLAVIEVVSPANKDREASVATFVEKAVEIISAGVNLLTVDLFAPGKHDPRTLHALIWDQFGECFELPPHQPFLAASYQAEPLPTAYLEPLALGDPLPVMPLFLSDEIYINLPLEPSYGLAWKGVPAIWRDVVEGKEPAP